MRPSPFSEEQFNAIRRHTRFERSLLAFAKAFLSSRSNYRLLNINLLLLIARRFLQPTRVLLMPRQPNLPIRTDNMDGVHATADGELRQLKRRRVDWPAICSDEAGFRWQSRCVDASTGGLGFDNCPPLTIGQLIMVELTDLGTFHCRVAWSEGQRCGVEFTTIDGRNEEAFADSLAAILPATQSLPSSRAAAFEDTGIASSVSATSGWARLLAIWHGQHR